MEKLKTEYTLRELTKELDVKIIGDENCVINSVCTIQQSRPGAITFLMNPAYKKYLMATQASAVILAKEEADFCPVNALVCHDPYYTYARIATYFDESTYFCPGIHSSVVIGEKCEIDSSVSIGAHCYIGQGVKLDKNVIIGPGCVINDYSEIGEGTYLNPNVTLYRRTKIGKRVLVGSGTVIGSDGFGIAKHKGIWQKVPQLGNVVIHEDVEIGANCTIDRGAIDSTIIEKGVKLDNLIQVGHNVVIGENTAIAACVGISGSTHIGQNCLIGGQAGFAGHLTICENVMITGGTAVTRSIREPGIYSSGVGGVVTNSEWRKNSARINRLDKLIERVKKLEHALAELKERKKT